MTTAQGPPAWRAATSCCWSQESEAGYCSGMGYSQQQAGLVELQPVDEAVDSPSNANEARMTYKVILRTNLHAHAI